MATAAISSHTFARHIISLVDGAHDSHLEPGTADPTTMDELMTAASTLDSEIQSIKAQVYKKLLANFTEFTQSFDSSLELKGKIDELLYQADEMTTHTIDPETGLRQKVMSALVDHHEVSYKVQENNSILDGLRHFSRAKVLAQPPNAGVGSSNITKHLTEQCTRMSEAIDHMLDQLIAAAIHFSFTDQHSKYNYNLSFSFNIKVPPLALPRAGSTSTTGSVRWHELVRTLNLLGLAQEKLRPLQKSILRNLIQPLIQFHTDSTVEISSAADRYATAEGSSISLTINLSHGRLSEATLFDDIHNVFEYIHQNIFLSKFSSDDFNAQQTSSDTEILTYVVGRHIAKETCTMILNHYLTVNIPLDIAELKQFGSTAAAAIKFEDDLISMGKKNQANSKSLTGGSCYANTHVKFLFIHSGFLNEADRELRDFVENIDIHYTNRKRDRLLKHGRAIIMNDDFNAIPVKDLDRDDELEQERSSWSIDVDLDLKESSISIKAKQLVDLMFSTLQGAALLSTDASPYLYQATRSLLDLFRGLMPVYHERTLTDVPALAILFYNDCMYIARELEKMSDRLESGIPGMEEVLYDDAIPSLKDLAKKWLDNQVQKQREELMQSIDEASGFQDSSLENNFASCERAMRQIVYVFKRLGKAWKPTLSPMKYYHVLGQLLDDVAIRVIKEIEDLEDISEKESHKLAHLCGLLFECEDQFDSADRLVEAAKGDAYNDEDPIYFFVPTWQKYQLMTDILELSFAEIMTRFRAGQLHMFKVQELTNFPEQKRIKLFLERSIERVPVDINEKAEEFYQSDGDPSEKLKHKIKSIFEIANGKYDDFTEKVATTQEQEQEAELALEAKGAEKAPTPVPTHVDSHPSSSAATTTAATTVHAAKAKINEIYKKLWLAHGDIRVSLDILNAILASYQPPNINAKDNLLVPPGMLKCENVIKATVPLSTQISNEKLSFGSKKNHLRKASQILMKGAGDLKKVMEHEDQFWEGAVRLRKSNWSIGVKPTGPGQQHRVNRLGTGSQLSVYYGFGDGKSYASADLMRNQAPSDSESAESKNIELHFFNQTNKVIHISLVRRGTEYCQSIDLVAPLVLSASLKDSTYGPESKKTLHSQLLSAQSSLFDWELYQDLVKEARILTNSVSIVDNEIILPINDDLELKISLRKRTDDDESPSSSTLTTSPINGARDYKEAQLCNSLSGTADIFRYAMQLIQHRRYRQNIKERTDSFIKSSRPGSGRTPGSFRQFHIMIGQRPTNMLSTALQTLQYYTFSRRIREVLAKVSRNLRNSWWEDVSIHSIDIKAPTPSAAASQGAISSGSSAPVSGQASAANKAPAYSMGAAVSICVGESSPSLRFVIRSYPTPCVVFHLPDRPTSPITHITEIERTLEQELAARAIRKICEIVNSITNWTVGRALMAGNRSFPSPRFVIDIDKRCVGVFQFPTRTNGFDQKTNNRQGPMQSATLSMKSGDPTMIALTCTQGGVSRVSQLHLEDELWQHPSDDTSNSLAGDDGVHPHDANSFTFNSQATLLSTRLSPLRTTEGFRAWIQQKILDQLEF
ncbi:Centromere/kinetochore protein zw10 [Podila humilis]|nr:Centromere/kinetochore protein zw10 [Podila humilis]